MEELVERQSRNFVVPSNPGIVMTIPPVLLLQTYYLHRIRYDEKESKV